MQGFTSFPAAVATNNIPVDKVRGKPEKFAEHYTQARLFFNSQSPLEQAHIIGAFRFELSKVTVPAIRLRMVSSLLNVSVELAAAVAEGSDWSCPSPCLGRRTLLSTGRSKTHLPYRCWPARATVASRLARWR